MSDAPFGRLLIVGAGLLGTSLALAVKRRWPAVTISAMDAVPRDHAPFDHHFAAAAAIPTADLTVLACPLGA